jgi:hypothetical protein
MARMRVMNPTGHTTTTWDPTDTESVEAVRKEFDELMSQGIYNAYDTTTRPGEPIAVFVDTAEEILLAPMMRGGSR